MSKEYSEAFKTIKIKCHPNSNPSPLVDEALEVVEKALTRLEAIENANPSEALSMFRSVELTLKENRFLNDGSWLIDSLNIIKQYILKAQEQGKVLNELIKLVNNLEPTFNHKGIFSDTDIVGTIIKDYFYGNISASLKRIFKENKE